MFTKGFNKEHYIREAQRAVGISPRWAQLVLEDLEKRAVLESKTRGKIKVYSIKKTAIAKDYLCLAETQKRINFMECNSASLLTVLMLASSTPGNVTRIGGVRQNNLTPRRLSR